MVTPMDISDGADGILAVEGINSIRDLKGKKIAAQKNFISEAFLNYLLIKEGLSPTDVEVIDTEGGAAGAAFVSGNVDVAVTFEPWLTKAKERRGGKLLISSKDVPGILVDVLLINEDYLRANKDTVAKVVRGWNRAVEFAKQNPAEANVIMAKYYKVTPEEFADYLTGVKWPSHEENTEYMTNGKAHEVGSVFSEVFIKTGQVKQKPDLTLAIDSTVLQSLDER
jgi:NitT/TauT family transport system substrate-binding protein